MSKKTLAVVLSKAKGFQQPKQSLEQYATDSEVAASALWAASLRGWVRDKIVADYGAGTGILGIGCLLLGARKVFFVEKDAAAIITLKENISCIEKEYYIGQYEIIVSDISMFRKKVDLIVMNPPFGTVDKNTDIHFLKSAASWSNRIITFHKTETSSFIENTIKSLDYNMLSRADTSFPLKKTLKHHKKDIERINVSFWLIEKHENNS